MTAKLEIRANFYGGYTVLWEDIPTAQQTYYPIVKRGDTIYYGAALGSASGLRYNTSESISNTENFALTSSYDLYLSPSYSDLSNAVSYGSNISDPFYGETEAYYGMDGLEPGTIERKLQFLGGEFDPEYFTGEVTISEYSSDGISPPACIIIPTLATGYPSEYTSYSRIGAFVYMGDRPAVELGTYTGDMTSGYINSTTSQHEFSNIGLFYRSKNGGVPCYQYAAEGIPVWLVYTYCTSRKVLAIIKLMPRINIAPSDIAVSSSTLNKEAGRTAPYIIGDITVTDKNAFDTHTLRILSQTLNGTEENYFIAGLGKLLALGTVPAGTHSVKIEASDGLSTYSKTFSIEVVDASSASLTAPIDFDATALSANNVQLSFTIPDGISSDTVIQWQRSTVDPNSEDFETSDWSIIATRDIYGNEVEA